MFCYAMAASFVCFADVPTKQETTGFLLSKIAERPPVFGNSEVKLDDNMCTVLKYNQGMRWAIPLTEVSVKYYQASVSKEYNIELACIRNKCINGRFADGETFKTDLNGFASDNDGIYLDKVAKALVHLKSLCGGTKELF